ncbi:MAG: PaaX family transcriptional regulator C-terminal domain-containing protein [bacterium]|nr:PaaX family transcriptional regulator C-terminal domain-containing protein [bacterium]
MKKACTITAILTLFGGYILPKKEKDIWVGSIIKLLKPLGFSPNAIRLSLSRMKKHKALESFKIGKESYYRITDFGMKWVKYGEERAFHFEEGHKWDRNWRLVIYNIPEKMRKQRDAFRSKLNSAGFASIGSSSYIYPHDFNEQVKKLAEYLKIQDYVEIFNAKYYEKDLTGFVERYWNIKKIEKMFKTFLNEYKKKFNEFKKNRQKNPAKCFAVKFKLMTEFIDLCFEDPKLPLELLPKNWIGKETQKFVDDFYEYLDPISQKYFNDVFKSAGMTEELKRKSSKKKKGNGAKNVEKKEKRKR